MKKVSVFAALAIVVSAAIAGAYSMAGSDVYSGWQLSQDGVDIGSPSADQNNCRADAVIHGAAKSVGGTYTYDCRYHVTFKVVNDTPVVVPDPMPDPTPMPTPGTWSEAAIEGQTFILTEQSEVRYGFGDLWIQRSLTGAVFCTNDYFGVDPAFGEYKVCQVLTPAVVTPPAPTSMMPWVNTALIPTGSAGSNQVLATVTTEQPHPSDGTGAFRTSCDFTHMNFDDPIVYPGQPGLSHLHAFFGNTATNATSTSTSIAGSGNSTCRGGDLNKSAYWAPAMIAPDGTPIKPSSSQFYYKSGYYGVVPSTIQPMPVGLRMIAGDMKNDEPGGQYENMPFSYTCQADGANSRSIPSCPAGSEIWMHVYFPQCWDGVNLDSPDHKSHMAYPSNGCPASHPVPLPEVTFNIIYPVTETSTPSLWRLSSDNYPTTKPGGYSGHGDWMNGWDPAAMQALTTGCINTASDCKSHLLGDGREIY